MPPSHKRGVFRTFVHRKKTSPREVESLYHKKSPLVNSCGRFFRIFRRPAEERRAGRENLCPAEERRGERLNLRRDTLPAHTASGGAARRTGEFAAGYAARTHRIGRSGEANGRICGGIRRPCPRRHSVGKDGCRRFPRTYSHLGRRDGQPNPSVRQQPRRACRMCTNIRSHRPGGAPASRCFACSRAGR